MQTMISTMRILTVIALLSGIGLQGPPASAQSTPVAQAGTPSPSVLEQRSFATPDEAALALKAALLKHDTAGLLDILGHDHADLLMGGDAAMRKIEQQHAAAMVRENLSISSISDSQVVLLLGKDNWPLPIPVVRKSDRWVFDTAAGAGEVVARRIGQDELGAISALKAFVAAQREYAAQLRAAGKPAQYARYIQSTPGHTDGLWWDAKTSGSATPSPLAKFAGSQREFLRDRKAGDPFRGYYFRILTGQGDHAQGGAMSYIENGRLAKGFAMIAWPAAYRESGVMTFLVSTDGRVLQKDLGEDTPSIVQGTRLYDPDNGWAPAE